MTDIEKALNEAREIPTDETDLTGFNIAEAYERFAQLVLAENKQKDELIKNLKQDKLLENMIITCGTLSERILHLEDIIKRAREIKVVTINTGGQYASANKSEPQYRLALNQKDEILTEAEAKQEEHHG